MYSSDEKEIFEKIIADVTPQELHFMKLFGIDDGDGCITNKEYVILIIVRIGAVRPELIRILHQRFRELDRKCTGFIEYDELMFRGIKLRGKDKFARAVRKVMALTAVRKGTSDDKYNVKAGETITNDSLKSSSQMGKVYCGSSFSEMDTADVSVHLSVRSHPTYRERAGTFDSGSADHTHLGSSSREFDDSSTQSYSGQFTPRRNSFIPKKSPPRAEYSPKIASSTLTGESVDDNGSGSGFGTGDDRSDVIIFGDDAEEAMSEAQRTLPPLPRPAHTPARRVFLDRLASIESVTTVGDADGEFCGIASGVLNISGDRDELSRTSSTNSLHGAAIAEMAKTASGRYFTFDHIPLDGVSVSTVIPEDANPPADKDSTGDNSPTSMGEAWGPGVQSTSSQSSKYMDDRVMQSRVAVTRLSIYDVAVAAVRQRRLSNAFRDKHAGRIQQRSAFGSFSLRLWHRSSTDESEEEDEKYSPIDCLEAVMATLLHMLRYNHYVQSILAW